MGLNLLFISLIIVNIIDLSGFIEEISEGIWKGLYPKIPYNGGMIPKPFSCSYCLTFGVGLLYIIITGSFSLLALVYILLLAFLTPIMGKILLFLKDLLDKVLEILGKLID